MWNNLILLSHIFNQIIRAVSSKGRTIQRAARHYARFHGTGNTRQLEHAVGGQGGGVGLLEGPLLRGHLSSVRHAACPREH